MKVVMDCQDREPHLAHDHEWGGGTVYCIGVAGPRPTAVTTDMLRRIDEFIRELHELGIHVGIGIGVVPVRCVVDGQPWPCRTEVAARELVQADR